MKKFYPLHFITLILAIPLYFRHFFTNFGKTVCELLANLFLIQAWIPIRDFYFSFNAVSWYLSVTAFFILITPLTVKLLKRLHSIQIVMLIIAVVCTQILFVYLTNDKEIAHWLVYVCPLIRSLDFICGEGMAVVLMKSKKDHISGLWIDIFMISALAILAAIFMTSINEKSEIYSSACWTLPVLILVGSLVGGEVRQSKLIKVCFSNKLIVFIGNISFELFLIHQLVIQYIDKIFNILSLENSIWQYLIAIAITNVAAIFCYTLKTKESTL